MPLDGCTRRFDVCRLPLETLAGVGDQGSGALMEAKRRGHELNIRMSDLERYHDVE